MNTIKRIIGSILFLLFCYSVSAQKSTVTAQLIQDKNFVFKANSVSPVNGTTQFITADYNLTLKGDTLSSYLPYFGRAFTATIGATRSPLDFTSTDFNYEVKARRKGGWNLFIKPDDHRNVQQLLLSVTENGNAILQVISNDRQSISFSGYIVDKT